MVKIGTGQTFGSLGLPVESGGCTTAVDGQHRAVHTLAWSLARKRLLM
jgi:hypothetical protein